MTLSESDFKQLIREEINKMVVSEASGEMYSRKDPRRWDKAAMEKIPALKPARALGNYVAALSPKEWQAAMRDIDSRVLAKAMATWTEKAKEATLGAMSNRAAKMMIGDSEVYAYGDGLEQAKKNPKTQKGLLKANDEIWGTIRRRTEAGQLAHGFDTERLKSLKIDTSGKMNEWLPKNVTELLKFMTGEDAEPPADADTQETPMPPGFSEDPRQSPWYTDPIGFDDLVYLGSDGGSESMQRVLKETDERTLALALVGAPKDLKQLFFSIMSKRAAEMIAEDIEAHEKKDRWSRPSQQQIKAAKEEIWAVIERLEGEGGILITQYVRQHRYDAKEKESQAQGTDSDSAMQQAIDDAEAAVDQHTAATVTAASGKPSPPAGTTPMTSQSPYFNIQNNLMTLMNKTTGNIQKNFGPFNEKSKVKGVGWSHRKMSSAIHDAFAGLFGKNGVLVQYREFPKQQQPQAAPAEQGAKKEEEEDTRHSDTATLKKKIAQAKSETLTEAQFKQMILDEILAMTGLESNPSPEEVLNEVLSGEDLRLRFIDAVADSVKAGKKDIIIKTFGSGSNLSVRERAILLTMLGEEGAIHALRLLSDDETIEMLETVNNVGSISSEEATAALKKGYATLTGQAAPAVQPSTGTTTGAAGARGGTGASPDAAKEEADPDAFIKAVNDDLKKMQLPQGAGKPIQDFIELLKTTNNQVEQLLKSKG